MNDDPYTLNAAQLSDHFEKLGRSLLPSSFWSRIRAVQERTGVEFRTELRGRRRCLHQDDLQKLTDMVMASHAGKANPQKLISLEIAERRNAARRERERMTKKAEAKMVVPCGAARVSAAYLHYIKTGCRNPVQEMEMRS